jgi:hypothetical protein
MVEHFPSKQEALSLISNMAKSKKDNRGVHLGLT